MATEKMGIKIETKPDETKLTSLGVTSWPKLASFENRLAMAKQNTQQGVIAGAKAAIIAGTASAIPTIASVRMLPWARANLNPTAQALIISTAAGAAYFIVAEKTVLAAARKNSISYSSEQSN